MFLRRLTRHVNNQNWFAAGLDLLIRIRYGGYVAVIEMESRELERLHLTLDQVLGVEHADATETP